MSKASLTRLSPDADLKEIEAIWRALELKADVSFFISWGWIGPWLQTVLPHCEVYLYQADNEENQPVALAAVTVWNQRKKRVFKSRAAGLNESLLPGLNMTIEYNGLLCSKGHEAASWTLFFNTLDQSNFRWTELILSGIDTKSWKQIQSYSTRYYFIEDKTAAPWIANIEGLETLDSILAKLSRNKRWQIRRSIKHYEENCGPLAWDVANTLEQALTYFEQMGTLHTDRWNRDGKAGAYANPLWVGMQKRVIEAGFTRGEVQLLRVTAGDHVLGFVYSFLWRETVYMFQTGLASISDNNQRPGYIAHCLAMAANGKSGMKFYDFMIGDSEYKQSLSTKGESLMWARARKPHLKNHIEDHLIKVGRKVKQRACLRIRTR